MKKRREDYQEAMRLRYSGSTYGEIHSLLRIPKSTLSTWFSTAQLPLKAREILVHKTREGIKALGRFNHERTLRIVNENETIRTRYMRMVGALSKRDLMLLGAALYWGEGHKNFSSSRKSYPFISFSNSDPDMIVLFIEFVERILGVPKCDLWGIAMIYPSLDPKKSIAYWRSISGIPKERFRCYSTISRASNGKRPRNLLPYGTLQIRVHKRHHFFKIRGLIDGIVSRV